MLPIFRWLQKIPPIFQKAPMRYGEKSTFLYQKGTFFAHLAKLKIFSSSALWQNGGLSVIDGANCRHRL